jgi:hypothetical protein
MMFFELRGIWHQENHMKDPIETEIVKEEKVGGQTPHFSMRIDAVKVEISTKASYKKTKKQKNKKKAKKKAKTVQIQR